MATMTPIPHTRIDNSVIDEYIPQIGLAGLGVYVIIKKYLNQQSGQCNPSYATIARKAGVDRSTIIRYVKKLKALTYSTHNCASEKTVATPPTNTIFRQALTIRPRKSPFILAMRRQHISGVVQNRLRSRSSPTSLVATVPIPAVETLPLPLVHPCHLNNLFFSEQKRRTIAEVDLMPTEKQKTCPHPPEFIVILPDNITICHHCYGLLDDLNS